MATDPNKDLESSKEYIRDINKNLKKIQDDYLKSIEELGQKTSLLPKINSRSAGELTVNIAAKAVISKATVIQPYTLVMKVACAVSRLWLMVS